MVVTSYYFSGAVRKLFPTDADDKIKTSISLWFQQAKARLCRR